MNWYKKSNLELKFENNHRDAYRGQNYYTLLARDNNNVPIGGIDYSEFEDQIYIDYIEVLKQYQRQGIGSKLYNKLVELWPNYKINWGMMTEEGYSLKESLKNKNELV